MFDNDYFDWEEACEEDGCDPADDYWDSADDLDDEELEFDWIEYEYLGTDDTYEGYPCDVIGADELEREEGNGSYWLVTAPLTERQCDAAGIGYPCSFEVRIPEEEKDLLGIMEFWLYETCPEASEWLSGLHWMAHSHYKYGHHESPEMYIRIEKLREAMEKDNRDRHDIFLATEYGWAEPYKALLKKELQHYGI